MPGPASPTPQNLALPTALAAFLRGVERRAAVLAELQAGDPTLGDAALVRAMAAFTERALGMPMAQWPRVFWRQLLAQPALRNATRARPPAFVPVCSPAVRVALLLRLAAGFDDAQAADVLGIAEDSVRKAVGSVLPRGPAGDLDADAWRALQAEVQRRVRELPIERSLRLANMREGALAGPTARFVPLRAAMPHVRALAAVGVLAALALVATYVVDRQRRDSPIRITALGPPGEPASRFDATTALIAHPDFDLLADPAQESLARDAAFLSWTVGHAAAPVDSDSLVAMPMPTADNGGAPDTESADAP